MWGHVRAWVGAHFTASDTFLGRTYGSYLLTQIYLLSQADFDTVQMCVKTSLSVWVFQKDRVAVAVPLTVGIYPLHDTLVDGVDRGPSLGRDIDTFVYVSGTTSHPKTASESSYRDNPCGFHWARLGP